MQLMNTKLEKAPKVSIITVVYNSVLTLEQTILYVLNQTYENIELYGQIIVLINFLIKRGALEQRKSKM